MTTTETTLTIVCPDWCTISAQEHADDLWNQDGECHHIGADIRVVDESERGPGAGFDQHIRAAALDLHLVTSTRPDGTESASPSFVIDGVFHSLEQVVALRAAVDQLIETYRRAGGVA